MDGWVAACRGASPHFSPGSCRLGMADSGAAAYLVLSSTSGAAECRGHALGEFWRLEAEAAGRAAYRQTDTEGGESFLFWRAGKWWVGPAVGAGEARCWLRGGGAPWPPPPGAWSHRCRCAAPAWRPDATLGARAGSLTPCREVTVAVAGEAASRLASSTGTFLPTKRWSQGRPIYQLGQDGQCLLLVGPGKTVWSVRTSVDAVSSLLLSGRATDSPGQPEAAASARFGVTRWRCRAGGGWQEEDVVVTAVQGEPGEESLGQPGCRRVLVKQRKLWQWWQVWW